ncbi:MAG: ABC transporter ATP-binding protein [Thermoplasmatales archaeon]|nr:ABC transporter ATP-binding protein [Thermoplasmatales archaeon]
MNVEMDGVCFSYTTVKVLNDITLKIQPSELVSIVGPNGVGKSTLLHCMNKILKPTSGTVLIGEKDLDEYGIKELAKHVGYVPYVPSDSFPLTVIDTVLMGRHPHSGWRFTESDVNLAYDIMDGMGISDFAMRPFNSLSAGQRQKVMLARGFAQSPEILLLDEPTSNLDVKHMLEVMKILRKMSKENGVTVIMVNHDLNMASKFADRMILMSNGGIHTIGTPTEVVTRENLRDVYGVESEVVMDLGRPYVILRDVVQENGRREDAPCAVPPQSVPS